MDNVQILVIIISLGILQFIVSKWLESRLENSIKHEYNKLIEDYKYNLKIREQAARVAEYFALARRLEEDSPSSDYERANQMTWELAMWLPTELYKKMVHAIAFPSPENNIQRVVIECRKLLLKENAGNLDSESIAVHGPGIGKKKVP